MRRLLLFCLTLITLQANAQINLYVDGSVSGSGGGTTWAGAYKTLGEAITYANNASNSTKYVINIAQGTYYPTGVQNSTKRDSTFLITRGGVKILGGYPSGGGTRNASTYTTVLSGDIGTAAITDNTHHIMVISGVSSTDSIGLDGLTFTKGTADGSTSVTYNGLPLPTQNGAALILNGNTVNFYCNSCTFANNNSINNGGGAVIQANNLPFTFSNCSFNSNNAFYGGGVFMQNNGSQFLFLGCTFSNDSAYNGGAMYNNSSLSSAAQMNCQIKNNTFLNNIARYQGAGLYNYNSSSISSSLLIDSCGYSGNIAGNGGGGIYTYSSYIFTSSIQTTNITNCNFVGDSALAGGGIELELSNGAGPSNTTASSLTQIANCTFSSNKVASNGGGIYIIQALNNTPVVTSVYISSCIFNNNIANNGGGLSMSNEVSKKLVNLYRSSFFTNTARVNGGGIYSAGGNIVDSCVLFGNFATTGNGGGIYCSNYGADSTAIRRSSIQYNIANNGGGLYINSNSTTNGVASITRSTISGNRALTAGGGIYNNVATPSINNTLITGNSAVGNGGALYNYNGGKPYIYNCTLAGDTSSVSPGIYNGSSNATPSLSTITNSIIWEGASASVYNTGSSSANITYSDVQGGFTGTGNINADPLFIRPIVASSAPDTMGNYNIIPCSPVVNAGHNVANNTLDILGNTRVFNVTTDMGAYEYQGAYPALITGNASVCAQSTIQLSNAFAGGTWTSSNAAVATISSAGLVTGVAAGVDTITYKATLGGCFDSVTKVITVNALPATPILSGDTVVCINSVLTLTGNVNGGTWASSNNAVATVSSTGRVTGIAGGLDTISYTVSNANGCRATTAKSVTVNATFPTVAPITGDTGVCPHGTIVLSDVTTGGTWTSYDTNKIVIDPVTGIGIAKSPSSHYDTIYYSVSAGGCATKVKKTIYVRSAPSAGTFLGLGSAYCFGGPGATLDLGQARTGGLAGGTWTSSRPAVATIDNVGVLTVVNGGVDTFTYNVTDASGCAVSLSVTLSFYRSYNDTIHATICSGDTYRFAGQNFNVAGFYTQNFGTPVGCDSIVTLALDVTNIDASVTKNGNTLTANQAGAVYQWYNCASQGIIAGATGQSFTPTTSAPYTVHVTYMGCTKYSTCIQVTVGVANVNEREHQVQVYPNPTTGKLTLNSGNETASRVVVMDITGRMLQHIVPTSAYTNIDLGGYAAGTYLVEADYKDGGKVVSKVNVQH